MQVILRPVQGETSVKDREEPGHARQFEDETCSRTDRTTGHPDRRPECRARLFLVLEEADTKTARPLEFELPRDAVKLMDSHLATRSPLLCPSGTRFLFPKRSGDRPVGPNALSARIAKRVRKETGLVMNAHLFRHFAVMVWLDANPGGYEVARRLLGHSDLSHTINMYSGLEIKAATRAFSDLINEKKGG
ncbi:hypothetical protein [Kordiimonas sp.]|uniref:hypothetical protein n=1 Tax=Kordiimonas sp. TaxID=1970157 RepID=UPI003A9375E3